MGKQRGVGSTVEVSCDIIIVVLSLEVILRVSVDRNGKTGTHLCASRGRVEMKHGTWNSMHQNTILLM